MIYEDKPKKPKTLGGGKKQPSGPTQKKMSNKEKSCAGAFYANRKKR
jgi:hypothetical protein